MSIKSNERMFRDHDGKVRINNSEGEIREVTDEDLESASIPPTLTLPKPSPLSEPSFVELSKVINQYIEFIASDARHEDNNYWHYIYEAALEAFYGKTIWDWINERR